MLLHRSATQSEKQQRSMIVVCGFLKAWQCDLVALAN
jgi:hypothetical protein